MCLRSGYSLNIWDTPAKQLVGQGLAQIKTDTKLFGRYGNSCLFYCQHLKAGGGNGLTIYD